jgi:hypothetical protein
MLGAVRKIAGCDFSDSLSDQIQRARASFGPVALLADAMDDQPVSEHSEMMFASHGVADLLEIVAAELDQLVAFLAMQVIVLRVTVVVFVDFASLEIHLTQQPRLDQLGECAIDARSARRLSPTRLAQLREQIVGIEMIVTAEDLLNNESAWR